MLHVRNEKKRRREKSKSGDYQYDINAGRPAVAIFPASGDGIDSGTDAPPELILDLDNGSGTDTPPGLILDLDNGSGTDTPPVLPSNNPTDPGGIEDDNIDTDTEDCEATWNTRECTRENEQRERSINGECNNLRNR